MPEICDARIGSFFAFECIQWKINDEVVNQVGKLNTKTCKAQAEKAATEALQVGDDRSMMFAS